MTAVTEAEIQEVAREHVITDMERTIERAVRRACDRLEALGVDPSELRRAPRAAREGHPAVLA